MIDRDTLVSRADAFTTRCYGQHVTARMVRDWVDEGLVPGPMRRGRGRGPGAAWDWSSLAYRRILQLSRLKQRGVMRRNAQMLALWFGTADFPYETVRLALLGEYRLARKAAQRSLPVTWDPRAQVEPASQHQRNALIRALGFGEVIPVDGENGFTLDAILPYLATMMTDQTFMADPTVLTDLMMSMIGFRDPSLRDRMVAMEEREIGLDTRVLTGLLADPGEVERSAEDAIAAASEEALINARDYLRVYLWWQRVLFPALLSVMPPMFGIDFGVFMQRLILPNDYKTHFTLFLHFVRRAQERGDAGRGMGIAARSGTPALRRLYVYLARNESARHLFRELAHATDRDDPAVRRQGRELARLLLPHGLSALQRAGREASRAEKERNE